MQNESIIEPPPVRFSFDAPGWYAVGAALLVLLALAVVAYVRYRRRNRYRREALQWLDAGDHSLYETDMLLKRVAMARYGRERVASLRGAEWTGFLNSCWNAADFTEEDARLIAEGLYAGRIVGDEAAFRAKARRWIIHHRHAL
ncbi:DUF4381 domain-containing protein [Chitinophaga lutea]